MLLGAGFMYILWLVISLTREECYVVPTRHFFVVLKLFL